jgi:3-phenylpropionate/trans-cinnamate dioxygenase ferredoxin component
MSKRWIKLGPESEIAEGEVRVFSAGEVDIAVARVHGALYAVEDLCTHDDGPLGEGILEGYEVECPRHGARFDVRTGAVCRMPAAVPVSTYPLKVENGHVLVELETE